MERTEKRLVLEPVQLELGYGNRIAATRLQFRRQSLVEIGIDDQPEDCH